MNDKVYYLKAEEFERLDQIDQYINCLRSNRLPLKFAYIGKTAHTHDQLVRSREYKLSDNEGRLIQNKLSINQISEQTDPNGINLIDIGPGNGIKASLIISLLLQKNIAVNYVALDYSDELLKIAQKNLTESFPTIEIQTAQIDFEQQHFQSELANIHLYSNFGNIFIFLGTTLGNPFNRMKALENIRNSMNNGDRLLIGVELYDENKISEVLSHYCNAPFYDAVFNPLTFTGLNPGDGKLEVVFNKETRNVEVHFIINNKISVIYKNEVIIEFENNDDLLIFISHRFTKSELLSDLSNLNLSVSSVLLDDESNYALFICSGSNSRVK